MRQLAVLNLGSGNCQQGFSTVSVQLWLADNQHPIQFTGALPAAPELEALYRRWRSLYEALSASLVRRSSDEVERKSAADFGLDEFEFDETDVMNVSRAEFECLCQELRHGMNHWLNAEVFRKIDRQLRTQLTPAAEVRFIITAIDHSVLRLPWNLWHFFEDYPGIELAMSPAEYDRSVKVATQLNSKVRILAVLGDRRGIDVSRDRQLLEQLPHTDLTLLIEPNQAEFNQQLWDSGWDVLFFAGHSSSQGKGQMQLNSTEALTIDQLKYGLKKAIAQGLKLAIFNSCDGLGLAFDLADLHIPQVIVMREAVPDRVAQEFLKHFLTAFSSGNSLYRSVRESREQLQSLEAEFPCATWLPVICQNPAEVITTWQDWYRQPQTFRWPLPTWQQVRSVVITSLVMTGGLVGIRWLGWLQSLELEAYDQFVRLRPDQPADSRLLVITVNDDDMKAQGTEPRQGSLSDRTLDRLLSKLEPLQPSVIGLDIYRDFPVGSSYPELADRLRQSQSLVAICKRPDTESRTRDIAPPPEVAAVHLGFSDFVEDKDGVLRRQLLQMPNASVSTCTPTKAFGVELAFRYLNAKGVQTEFTPEGNLKLGNRVFERLQSRTAGYQSLDARGTQLLLNYRGSPWKSFPQVTLTQVLTGTMNPNDFKDRIIVIGTIFANNGDYWPTPYGKSFMEQVPGVLLQAQMVSQLVSAGLDRRPLVWVWTPWEEVCWIWGWALVGGILACRFQALAPLGVAYGVAGGVIVGGCFLLFAQGGWVPLVPSVFALLMTGIGVNYGSLVGLKANQSLQKGTEEY